MWYEADAGVQKHHKKQALCHHSPSQCTTTQLEHKVQRRALGVEGKGNGWGGGNTAHNSFCSSGARESRVQRGRIVGRTEYVELTRGAAAPAPLPPVAPPPPAASAPALECRTRTAGGAAGLPTRVNTVPVLPLNTHPPLPRPRKERPPPATAAEGSVHHPRKQCALTSHLHYSLNRGHGTLFDTWWGGRFNHPIIREKGWTPGLFGASKTSI